VSESEKYVFAAYTVVLATVLIYLLIISLKVSRLDRELGELARRAQERRAAEEEADPDREEAPVG
jgi:CcmD family protein